MTSTGKPARFNAKVCTPKELADHARTLKGPVVFTNGVFDLLHRGHVTYLDQAAQEGASLIVAVNSDASVKRLGKGPDRPINTQEDRMAVLAALECVSLVTYFEEDTPLNAILAARPDVLVKGGDWPVEKMVGAREVQAWGGRAVSIAFEHERSTTATLEKIRKL
ncbi:D-glycero-beta-D-manno-heptose 1-phosphate adenylyltransferase [Limnobacter humi]|uniref:D-glycero-beta-D-manno-heptose 1-phosphate adenylyltransferase n=1 Tax=Limnobacter humi TaxID=1778671 RepID=A0ABT1WBN2_9BURK|nr:D-glycero-beta-D-manno-heptose 1-phosphate adenylyltransferase [Limnobacter humi]MCQ8894920.1 D-glycero-beta-D-manno-heptose 1-phosphate adenylyltransferase [Limnobacter humi]